MAYRLQAQRRLQAFLLYLILGLATAGWYAVRDPAGVCACVGNADPALFMWSLGWWPHALGHGLSPLVSRYVWAPVGVNLAQHTTIPTAALAAWPLTALFGPVVSYNVLAIASPVLAAFTAYLLCRRLSGSHPAALAGGYLFGFGPYMFAQLVGHLNLTLVFLVPAIAHLALRRSSREISSRLYIAALAVLLALQMGLSTEVLFTAVALGFICLLFAWALSRPPDRRRIGTLVVESAAGVLIAAAIASPFVYYALLKGPAPHEAPVISDQFGLDLLNVVIPTPVTLFGGAGHLGAGALGGLANAFEEANVAEADGYLSLPMILAFLAWAVTARRRMAAKIAALAAAVSLLAALGSHLHVDGSQSIWLPYDLVRDLPVVSLITPSRIVMFTSLALAVGVAIWLGEGRAERAGGGGVRGFPMWARWTLVALGIALLIPNVPSRLWGQRPANPAFFTGDAYRRHLPAGATILALPFAQNGNSMLWQAETGFRFKMPEGYLGHFAPASFASQPIVSQLSANEPAEPAALAAFIRRYHVSAVVVDRTPGVSTPYEGQLGELGLHGASLEGVTLYGVPPGWAGR